jgi:dTDP-4-amino-4,6-dideoxygalactose transaminase
LHAGDEILVPAYNCGTEIDPFLSQGLSVIFYRVDRAARIDFEDLQRRVTSNTRAIYVTHYFGWPHDISLLSTFCKNNNIYLVEDCALSLFSHPAGSQLGLSGDAAIYSFPKTLPVPDGGALTLLTDVQPKKLPVLRPSTHQIIKEMLPFFKRAALRFSDRIGLFPYLPSKFSGLRISCNSASSQVVQALPEIPESYYYDTSIQDMTVSTVTRYILQHTDPKEVIAQRRQNYLQIHDTLKGSHFFKPLYSQLPEGVCPLFFPVIVENREVINSQLAKRGIAALQWWSGFHRAFLWDDFPDARYLKEHLLALPIHQQLTFEDINYMIHALEHISSEN